MNNSILLTKNFKKLPERLIYKQKYKNSNIYKMANKNGNFVGQMIGNMTTETICSQYYPSFKSYNSFKIHYLKINEKKQGHGKAFINLAIAESYKNSGKGKVHLDAGKELSPNDPPHIKYRKMGFNSIKDDQIKYIDYCIKHKKETNPDKLYNIPMYYCPKQAMLGNQKKQKTNFFDKFKLFIKAL